MKKIFKIHLSVLKQVIFLVSLLFLARLSFAQSTKVPSLSPNKRITQFSIDTWDTEQGLPSKVLLYLEQTTDGYLWISSFQGLFRFDGVIFESFNTKKAAKGLDTNIIKDLFEKEDGTLCISTSHKGLVTYKNKKFEQIGNLDIAVQTTLFDTPNHAWIGTKNYGVYELNDTTFTPYLKVETLKNIRISEILKDNQGNIWFATEGNGLTKIDKKGNHTIFTTKEGLLSNKVGAIFQDSQNKVWIGTSEGLCFLENGEIKTLKGTENYLINKILEDYYGSLWMASEAGILRFNNKTKSIEVLTEENGLPHKNIQDILLDREGNIWFAMYRAGLGRIKESKFSNYTNYSGLASKSISAIHELGENDYLVATDAGLIDRIKDNVISVFNFKTKLPNDRLKNINSDSHGNILVSTYSGLLIIAPDGTETLYNKQNKLPENQIRVTFEDHLGNIWIGTRGSGLIKMTPERDFFYYNKMNSNLSSNFVMSIHQDKDNNLLVGSNNAGFDVIKIKNARFDVKNYKKELTGVLVFNTYTDIHNVTWITSNSGLNRLENGNITQYTIQNGLPDDICYDILEDDMANLWISSDIGIMRIAKQELNDFAKGKIEKISSVKVFNKADGMVSKDCTGAAFSIKTLDGHLMFPTLNGLTFINPRSIVENKIKPLVHIEKLEVDNQEIDLYEEIKIQSGKQRFTFHFTALSLTAPQNVSLKYKLEGYDEEWTESKKERQTVYTGLPYGKYTFKVKASNNDGLWNEEGATLEFEIEPHFYQTIPFYIVVFVLLNLLTYGAYRFRLRSIRLKNKKLEALILERTEEVNAQNEELLVQRDKIQEQNKNLELAYNDISMLGEMGKEVTRTLDLDTGEFSSMLYKRINKLMKADGFGVGIYDKKNNCLNFKNYIENGKELPFFIEKVNEKYSLAIKCFESQEVTFIQDLTKAIPYKNISNKNEVGLKSKALIYIPLLFEKQTIGVITVQSFETNTYKRQDITILQSLGSYISIALVNAKSYTAIEKKNSQITASINYASRIQEAFLAINSEIKPFLPDNFIFFKPRDVVSGDFYFFAKKNNKIIIAAVDCTGHGVPGAMMSMIGEAYLSQIIHLLDILSPDEILSKLHHKIHDALLQDDANYAIKDGMDMVICVIDKDKKVVEFAGAKNPLIYIKDDELYHIKGTRLAIGGNWGGSAFIPFEKHTIAIESELTIYLFTDGFQDQFGGENDRKFMIRNLKQLLLKNHHKSLPEQKQALGTAFDDWKGNNKQIDDVLLVGFKIDELFLEKN